VDAAGGVLHHEQHVEPLEQQGVDAEEVRGENAVGLGSQELPPTRPGRCAGCFRMIESDLYGTDLVDTP
jgi:hypothetical protein